LLSVLSPTDAAETLALLAGRTNASAPARRFNCYNFRLSSEQRIFLSSARVEGAEISR
jgi:hypothetical protein